MSAEQISSLTPDVAFAYSVYGFGEVATLSAARVPVVGVLNATEPRPLGDAEWATCFAAFFNAEGAANHWISEVSAHDTKCVAQAHAATSNPGVIMVSLYSAHYFEAHQNNWAARLVEDVGGPNLLASDGATAPVSISPEVFLGVGGTNTLAGQGVYAQVGVEVSAASNADGLAIADGSGFAPAATHAVFVFARLPALPASQNKRSVGVNCSA